ncbi:type IV secretion system protein [Planctomycetota bacterium]|nr:type IV secretion system protein [Planctomycetota bacterium]
MLYLLAQNSDIGSLITDFYNAIEKAINNGSESLLGDVTYVFNFLLVLTIVWTGIMWAISESPIAPSIIRRLAFISILVFFMNNWVDCVEAVRGTFESFGLRVDSDNSNLVAQLFNEPGKIMGYGAKAAQPILEHINMVGFSQTHTQLMLAFTYFVMLGFWAALCFMVLLNLVIFKIGGVIAYVLLPFAMFDKTAFLAERPISWVFSAGTRIMAYAMTLGISISYMQNNVSELDPNTMQIGQAIELLIISALLGVFVIFCGKIASHIGGGIASLGLHDASSSKVSGQTKEIHTKTVVNHAGSTTTAQTRALLENTADDVKTHISKQRAANNRYERQREMAAAARYRHV